ncbi:hypothetical protein VNO77_44789 [Canavalia gladiata]|uniref:Uncharacterized protein n=1 Tax=Canavalia gladiata TaxID=3824 RepID=A0AAN9PQR8_CANGL
MLWVMSKRTAISSDPLQGARTWKFGGIDREGQCPFYGVHQLSSQKRNLNHPPGSTGHLSHHLESKYTDLDLYIHPHKHNEFLVSILALHLHPSCDSMANLNELRNMSDAGWRTLKLHWRESHVDADVDLFNICFEGPARRKKKEANIPCKPMHKMADHMHFSCILGSSHNRAFSTNASLFFCCAHMRITFDLEWAAQELGWAAPNFVPLGAYSLVFGLPLI